MPLLSSLTRRPLILLAAALGLLAAWAAADWYAAEPPSVLQSATYVGRQSCITCHQVEYEQWLGSDHDRAMETATDETVLGDFNDATFVRHNIETRFYRDGEKYMVRTEGPDGEYHDYHVKYTFGIRPLQQYMVEFPDGRIQVLRESWDVDRQQWFFVTPDDVPEARIEPGDPLHWTGLAQNWNTMCAECHTTDYHKNYDFAKDEYHSTYKEIDVSCEMCHGPGSVHVQLAESRGLFWDRNVGYGLVNTLKCSSNAHQVDTCAPCHSRRAQIHPDWHAGDSYFDHFEPQLLQAGLYHADGQILDEVYVYGSFLQSKMYHKDVRCSDCHDPHSLKLKYEGNRLCAQCHQPGIYDTPNHHRHVNSVDGTPETLCVNCHMTGRTYMNIDFRRDHSFRVPRPDISAAIGTPNACNGCHDTPEEDAAWAAAQVREWYGDKRPDDPRWAAAIDAGRRADPEGERLLRDVIDDRDMPAIVRATAIELLAQYAGPENLKLLNKSLDDRSPMVRGAAVRQIPLPPPDTRGLDPVQQAAANPWNQTRGRFVKEVSPLLDDHARSVRLAAANRLIDAADELTNSGFRSALDEAIAEFRQAQQMHLDRAPAHLSLAGLATRLGDLPAAIRSLRNAIEREPYLTGPRGELARLLDVSQQAPQEARELRQQEADLLARDATLLPNDPGPHYRRGMLLYLLGELDDARRELVEACRLGPNDYQNWMALALICERQERWREAISALERMVQLQPENPAAGLIYQRIQQTLAQQRAEQPPPDEESSQ